MFNCFLSDTWLFLFIRQNIGVMLPLRRILKSSFMRGKNAIFSTYRSNVNSYERQRWEHLFKTFTGLDRLTDAKTNASFVESSYFSNKRDKDQCWQLLIISQQQLENVHCQIDPLPVQDKNYSNVLSEEVSVIKTIRSLSLDFNLHDKVTQDNLRSFSSVAEDCLDIQMKCEKRIITLYGFATLASLALGSLVFYISLSLGEYVSLKDNVYDKYEDNEDLSDLMSWVYKQNDKLKKYIKDLWNTIEFDQSYTFKQMSTHNLNADESILEQDNALGSITLQNKQLLGDMLTVECAVSSLKEFNEFPELIMLKNQNSIEENRGLWITTLAYGAAAMIIPALLV